MTRNNAAGVNGLAVPADAHNAYYVQDPVTKMYTQSLRN